MEPLLTALRGLGAEAHRDDDGTVTVRGPLRPGSTTLDATASSQYLSAMLLVLPVLKGDWRIDLAGPLASRGYVDLTLEALDDPSYARIDEGGATIEGGVEYPSIERTIEGDWSAAAFLLAAGLLGGEVRVQGLVNSSRQPDRALLGLIEQLNGDVSWEGDTLIARRSELNGAELDVSDTPDLFPAVLLLAARARGTTTITGTARLRYKESDRVSTCTDALRAMGADIAVGDDRVVVRGVPSLRGAEVTSHGDHRVAMMAVTAGLAATAATTVLGVDCVDVSWPGFLEAVKGLGARVDTTAPLP
jgi:3-phosphoshikimate 1-carboxyvinyltransferase